MAGHIFHIIAAGGNILDKCIYVSIQNPIIMAGRMHTDFMAPPDDFPVLFLPVFI